MQNLKTPTFALFATANFDVPVLFHVVVEFLDKFNSVDRPKTLVAHEPMGFLLGQGAEPLERGLGNFSSSSMQSFILFLVDKTHLLDHQE